MLCDLLGFTISWNKVTAGEEISWIGFEILLHSYSLGVTASRNDWAIRWCTKLLEDGCGHTDTLADGLGRLSFMCGALETLRVFLSPFRVTERDRESPRAAGRGGRNTEKHRITDLKDEENKTERESEVTERESEEKTEREREREREKRERDTRSSESQPVVLPKNGLWTIRVGSLGQCLIVLSLSTLGGSRAKRVNGNATRHHPSATP